MEGLDLFNGTGLRVVPHPQEGSEGGSSSQYDLRFVGPAVQSRTFPERMTDGWRKRARAATCQASPASRRGEGPQRGPDTCEGRSGMRATEMSCLELSIGKWSCGAYHS